MTRGAFLADSRRAVVACLVIAAMLSVCLPMADAALVLASSDARDDYPTDEEALFRTADLPNVGDANINNRGVRSNRIQSQTFQVTEKISVESIFIGYRWNSDPNWASLPTTFRVIEVDNVGGVYDRNTVNVLAGPVTAVVEQPDNVEHQGYYALQLDWTGSQPLILEPRIAPAGYAVEFVGAHEDDSPIAILRRDNDPMPNSRALEMSLSGTSQGGLDGNDFIVAITGTVVPEPSSVSLVTLGLLGVAARRRRNRKGDVR